MESLTGAATRTLSVHCESDGDEPSASGQDTLLRCPHCGAPHSVSEGRLAEARGAHERADASWLDQARALLREPGPHLAFEDDGKLAVHRLGAVVTRVGRSLSADIRFDDPTVSRRHALLERRRELVRVLDDRSLNGIVVNGEPVDCATLADGDVLEIGRHRLVLLDGATLASSRRAAAT